MDIENREINTIRPFSAMSGSAKTLSTPAKAPVTSTTSIPITNKSMATPRPTSAAPSSAVKRVLATPSTPMMTPRTTTTAAAAETPSAREAAKIAKLQSTVERLRKVSDLKEKWAKEKEDKLQKFKEIRETEIRRLHEASQMTAEQRKKNVEVQRRHEQQAKELEKEMLRSSLEERAHSAREIERMEKERRRQSILLNSEIKKKAKDAEKELEDRKKEEEAQNLELRRLDALRIREAKRIEEERRRESMAFRGEEERRKKTIQMSLEQARAEEERSLMDFRKQAWEDDRKHHEDEQRRKRESMAGRIEAWRQSRRVEEEQKKVQARVEEESFDLRWQDWREVEAYRQKQCQQSRESLAHRLDKWRQEKAYDAWTKSEQVEAEEYERELTNQAREDVARYEESQRRARRESLAYRLDKARKDKDFESGQKALRDLVIAEERKLQSQDRQDVANYQEMLLQAKRQSLEYRNQVEFQERLRLEGERQAAMEIEAEDHLLTEAAWRDVKNYQEKLREQSRKSLAFRLAESRRQHEVDLELHREALDRIHDELEAKRQNWLCLNEYKAAENNKRRMSVAYRIDSWKKEKLAEAMFKANQSMIEEENARLRAQDWEDLQNAKRELELQERHDRFHGKMIF